MVGRGKELSPSEVATRFGVSTSTVLRWEVTGELVPVRVLPSGYRRYSPDDCVSLEVVLAMPRGEEREAAMQALKAANLARGRFGSAEAEPAS